MAYSSSEIKTGLPGEDYVHIRDRLGELFGESPTLRRIQEAEGKCENEND